MAGRCPLRPTAVAELAYPTGSPSPSQPRAHRAGSRTPSAPCPSPPPAARPRARHRDRLTPPAPRPATARLRRPPAPPPPPVARPPQLPGGRTCRAGTLPRRDPALRTGFGEHLARRLPGLPRTWPSRGRKHAAEDRGPSGRRPTGGPLWPLVAVRADRGRTRAESVGRARRSHAAPHEPGLPPRWLAERGVRLVSAGGMGQRALGLFAERAIDVIVGAPAGSPEELVSAWMDRLLTSGSNVRDH